MKEMISRRSFLRVMGLGFGAAMLTACNTGTADSPADSPAASVPDADTPVPFLTEDEFPRLDGSTACIPLMAQMKADVTGMDLLEAQTSITVSTTAYAWENFGLWSRSDSEDYGAQLLIVYEAPEYVKEELAEADAKLEQKAIGRDALVFIVNEENPVQSLTQQQLRDIYAGRITNWKDVGGADSPIVAFQRGVDSGSQTLFKKLLIDKGDGQLMAAPTELAPADMGGLVDSIAEYNNSANAIGFSVYYYIDQMYSKPGLRLLAVDGVTPGNDTIADESYPLCNEFYAVVHADAAPDSPQRKVYDWLDTDEGRRCIEKAGYVALLSHAAGVTAPQRGQITTTAASGGNRESLLGQRPARRKRSAADAGCRNPGAKYLWRDGQAHAGRAKFFYIENSSALLQRAAASEQYPVKLLLISVAGHYFLRYIRLPVSSRK